MIDVPAGLARTFQDLFGADGEAWVRSLPALVEACAQRWSLTIGPSLAPLTYAYVAPAVRADGATVILKLAYPGREQRTEIEALRLFGGEGAAGLLEADPSAAALLLERLEPGTMLRNETDDARATAVAAQVMQRLWRPVPTNHGFPSVADWAEGVTRYQRRYAGTAGPLPVDLVELAQELFRDLLATTSGEGNVVLHGDLHHDNILLDASRGWLAIDPKGVVGDPTFEVTALLRNPWNGTWAATDPVGTLDCRIDVLAAALGFPRERIVRWGVASAVLSACWSVEDHGDGGEWSVTCARWLAELM